MPRVKAQEWPKIMDYTCSHEMHEFDGEYGMTMCCSNCGYQFTGRFTCGHESFGAHECPRCGCESARAKDWVALPAKEAGK